MGTIFEASRGRPSPNRPATGIHWRDELMVARFRNAEFHVESVTKENGRRVVDHEFPKKESPYAEDMGRRAISFGVRGYCIAFPFDHDNLHRKDYRIPRDRLIAELEKEGRGVLQLPTLPPMVVVVSRYRIQEDSKTGGYCVFDMDFNEFGYPPSLRKLDAGEEIKEKADAMRKASERRMKAIQMAMRATGGEQIAKDVAGAKPFRRWVTPFYRF